MFKYIQMMPYTSINYFLLYSEAFLLFGWLRTNQAACRATRGYTDSRQDEQDRGITVKASSMSLVLQDSKERRKRRGFGMFGVGVIGLG